MSYSILADDTTGAGQAQTINSSSPTGILYVDGLSQDTVTLQSAPTDASGAAQGPKKDLAQVSSDGFTKVDPLPQGEYSLSRSGENDSVTVLLQH